MNKLIIGILLCLFSVLVRAELQVKLDSDQISIAETFQLILTQSEPRSSGLPDLSVLQKDFVIVGTEYSSSYSIINGQTQSVNQWVIILKAKKTGTLTIPAIKIGTEYSKPTSIDVQSSNKPQTSVQTASKTQDVLMDSTIDEKKPYINQQVIYTVKLYLNKQVINVNYQWSPIDNALQIPLGDPKDYQTIMNNTSYMVREIKYAVFPQKSGPLPIIAPIFSAITYELDPKKVQVQDKTINLTIQPIPKPFDGKTWLPAKDVKLTEEYENSTQNMSQGSTLTRIIKIEATALVAELIPTIEFKDSDEFKIYPEKGTMNNPLKDGELVGSKEIKITYLFNKAGKVVIPEVRLPWFNTKTGKKEVAVLAPRSIEIAPSATSKTTSPSVPKSTPQPSESVVSHSSNTINNWPWFIAAFFAIAWLITMGLWGWQRRSKNLGKGSYKTALNELEQACHESNPLNARDALLKWAALHWPDAQILNLNDIKKLVKDAHFKKQIDLLAKALYKDEEGTSWHGDELLRAVYSIKRGAVGRKKQVTVLPPINPL